MQVSDETQRVALVEMEILNQPLNQHRAENTAKIYRNVLQALPRLSDRRALEMLFLELFNVIPSRQRDPGHDRLARSIISIGGVIALQIAIVDELRNKSDF